MGRPQPEQLARELKVVLKAGTRPAALLYKLDKLPGLVAIGANGISAEQVWDRAIAVCEIVTDAIDGLGEGPYGIAAAELFGTHSQTRGLLLAARRRAAAVRLEQNVSTFVRHYERNIILDVVTLLWSRVRKRSSWS